MWTLVLLPPPPPLPMQSPGSYKCHTHTFVHARTLYDSLCVCVWLVNIRVLIYFRLSFSLFTHSKFLTLFPSLLPPILTFLAVPSLELNQCIHSPTPQIPTLTFPIFSLTFHLPSDPATAIDLSLSSLRPVLHR